MSSESLNEPPLSGSRSTWAEINLDNLVHNYHLVQQRVGPEVNVMAMLKADAYGHGAVRCAQSLSTAGVQWFGIDVGGVGAFVSVSVPEVIPAS